MAGLYLAQAPQSTVWGAWAPPLSPWLATSPEAWRNNHNYVNIIVWQIVAFKKSYCLRIGPRYNANCATVCTTEGFPNSWCDEIRYLSVHIVSARTLNSSFKHAKESFYRAFNAIFGKIGRIASEYVIVHLINAKCMSVLLYGVEVCPLKKSQTMSLRFAVNDCFMKLFKSKCKDTVHAC